MLLRSLMATLAFAAATLPAATVTNSGHSSCSFHQSPASFSSGMALTFFTSVQAPYSLEPLNYPNTFSGIQCHQSIDLKFYTLPDPLEGEIFLNIRTLRNSTSGAPNFTNVDLPYELGSVFSTSISSAHIQHIIYTSSYYTRLTVSAFRRVTEPNTIATFDIPILLFEGTPLLPVQEDPVNPIPEPSTLALAAAGLLAYLPIRRRSLCPQ